METIIIKISRTAVHPDITIIGTLISHSKDNKHHIYEFKTKEVDLVNTELPNNSEGENAISVEIGKDSERHIHWRIFPPQKNIRILKTYPNPVDMRLDR